MKSNLSRRINSGPLFILACVALCGGVVFASDGSSVNHSATASITAHASCRKITNASPTGLSVYVPTQTSAEWTSFYGNPPSGVTIASCVTPGSQTYSTAGTYSFVVPAYNTLTVELWGAGGGGSGTKTFITGASTNGGDSRWHGGAASGRPEANGGTRGQDTAYVNTSYGIGGTGQNCDVSSTGQNGEHENSDTRGGKGGNAGSGGAGGARRTTSGQGYAGAVPGGAGGGAYYDDYDVDGDDDDEGGRGGGGGGYCRKVYAVGAYATGASVTVVVGAAGVGERHQSNVGGYNGGNGAAGRVRITWN